MSFSRTDAGLCIYHLFVVIIITYYSLEFFTSATSNGLSLEIE